MIDPDTPPIEALHRGRDFIEYVRMHSSILREKNQWRLDMVLETLDDVRKEIEEDSRAEV